MSELAKRIKEGIEGKFQGLDNGFKDLNKVLFGVQKKCYTLIGGMSGTFKTTLLDYIIIHALLDAESKNIPIDIFYYSFEIDELTKKCNWLSQLSYSTYGIVIPPEKIKGLGNNRLNEKEQEIINNLIPQIDILFSKINFRFEQINPTGIHHEIFNHCKLNGELQYEKYLDENNKPQNRIIGYKANDNRYTIMAMDHLYLLRKERNFSTKENMDKMSEYIVSLRNIFDLSAFVIQQFNQGLSNVDRAKFKGIDLSPSQTDFKDTTNPYQDCDVALGIMNPYKLNLDTCMKYDVEKLGDSFIMLKVIKNRLSKDNVAKGIYCHPSSGRFEELPPYNEINYENYK